MQSQPFSRHAGAILAAIAVVLAALAGWGLLISSRATDPRPLTHDTPVEPAEERPAPVHTPISREPEPWAPDGRLWVRVAGPDGEAKRAFRFGWHSAATARQVASSLVEAGDDGWTAIAVPPGAASHLFLTADGCLTSMLPTPDTSRRHHVRLEGGFALTVFVSDVETSQPIEGADVAVSGQDCWDRELGETRWMAGAHVADAIYSAVTDDSGAIRLTVPSSLRAVTLHPHHAQYLVPATQPLTLPGPMPGSLRVHMQMPVVGAIRYQGGEVVSQRLASGLPTDPLRLHRDTLARLDRLRARLVEDSSMIAIALLPDLEKRRWRGATVAAKVTLRRGGSHDNEMELEWLSRFGGPQVVVPAAGPEAVLAEVTLRKPPDIGLPYTDLAFEVSIKGPGHRLVHARLGETIRLPPGRYSMQPRKRAGDGLARKVYEVPDGNPVEWTTEWREATHCYCVELEGAADDFHFLQVRVTIPREVVLDAWQEPGTNLALFWSPHEYETGEVFVRGWMPEGVTFARDAAGGRRSRCVLTRRR